MSEPGQDQDLTNWQDWENYKDLPVGDVLRQTREHFNLSLADVAAMLRIRAAHLEALEQGRIDLLPGRVYAIGFVRAYAEYLGLDGDKIVHLFKTQSVGNKPKPELHFPAAASQSKIPGVFILAGSLAALLAILVGLTVWSSPDLSGDEIPPVPAEMKAVKVDLSAQSPLETVILDAMENASGEEGPRAFVEPDSRIVVTAVDNAWVEIRDSKGKVLLSRILKPGDSYLVPDEEGLKMDTGNAGALDIGVDGGKAFRLGERGDVRRGVALDPDIFLEMQAQRAILPEPNP